LDAGQKLRVLREQLHFSIRDVVEASERIAHKYGKDDYLINLSRLSDIETKGVLPNIYRLFSLSVIYRRDVKELLRWYEIPVDNVLGDSALSQLPATHPFTMSAAAESVNLPFRLDPGFNQGQTSNIGRFVETWGTVPLVYLEKLAKLKYTYGYIGLDDWMMYPILAPGSLVQVDETKNKIAKEGRWRSEYERPIYFIETREKFFCCWCRVDGDEIIAEPHPLSPVRPRIIRRGTADILGQVVGVAMRLPFANGYEIVPKAQQ
jgi:transcriptional regulator with XRE-family HTH domain